MKVLDKESLVFVGGSGFDFGGGGARGLDGTDARNNHGQQSDKELRDCHDAMSQQMGAGLAMTGAAVRAGYTCAVGGPIGCTVAVGSFAWAGKKYIDSTNKVNDVCPKPGRADIGVR